MLGERKEDVILEAKNLYFSYEKDGQYSLSGLNMKIKRGRRTAIMGANGSGKSTFFLCCNGIHKPDKGEIWFAGKPVEYSKKGLSELRSRVGIVFQNPDNQLFSASVRQEISFGILNLGASQETAGLEVDRVMEFLEITPFQDRPVHALSGGQKKQVAIADILVMHPDVIIMDEPSAALDSKHTRQVNSIVDQMTEQGITVLMATHDMDYAFSWADEIVLLYEGRVLKQGSPEEVCQDHEALKKTNLEKPMVMRVFEKLCSKGVLNTNEGVPHTIEELESRIGK